jgi:hypothetical protein
MSSKVIVVGAGSRPARRGDHCHVMGSKDRQTSFIVDARTGRLSGRRRAVIEMRSAMGLADVCSLTR